MRPLAVALLVVALSLGDATESYLTRGPSQSCPTRLTGGEAGGHRR